MHTLFGCTSSIYKSVRTQAYASKANLLSCFARKMLPRNGDAMAPVPPSATPARGDCNPPCPALTSEEPLRSQMNPASRANCELLIRVLLWAGIRSKQRKEVATHNYCWPIKETSTPLLPSSSRRVSAKVVLNISCGLSKSEICSWQRWGRCDTPRREDRRASRPICGSG
jgi:hypothetical protein